MRILVTGAGGFIAKNLLVHLRRLEGAGIVAITRESTLDELERGVAESDFVFHIAGVNRPKDAGEFTAGNTDFTRRLCELLAANGRKTPILFTSSIQAAADNPYGVSKRAAEDLIREYGSSNGARVYIYRLPERLRQMVPSQLQFGGGDILSPDRAR